MLPKKEHIANYTITFPCKEGAYAETYRVKGADGKNYFLKLINCSKLNRRQFDNCGNIVEVDIAKQLHHDNITSYHDSGEIILNNKRYAYIVFDFISGETVAEKVTREQRCSVYDAKQIVLGVLNGLKYLHSLQRPVIHNELTIQNVMLDMTSGIPVAKMIDFGYARYMDMGISAFDKDGLNLFYVAPEALNGDYSVRSDLFSVGVMLYHLLYGMLPYHVDLSDCSNMSEKLDAILEARQRPLRIPDIDIFELDEQLLNIISKALSINVDDRFQSADEFIKALNGEITVEVSKRESPTQRITKVQQQINIKKGNGFADVAGMTELKNQLQSDVIDLLQDPEQAKSLGISIPNGLLFYGPPGCGKTFFAEKFAEEIGCNYQYVKCSDIASPFIHGGQDKIAAVFDNARKNAPTILFFDEIDAMIKDRRKQNNVSEAGEVNEFLTQLNNCGHDGVLVIGATNRPGEIDEAALRAGRLELKYYIPLPDKSTREKMFEIELSHRKVDFGIDYEKLAEMTDGYISADIRLIVDTSARMAFRQKTKITELMLMEAIKNTKPSLTKESVEEHENIRRYFEGDVPQQTRKKVGF